MTENKSWCGHEPGFVYATFYHSVITYFLIENLFGGKQHLGMPEDEAIDRMIDLAIKGLWKHSKPEERERAGKKTLAKTHRLEAKPRGAQAGGKGDLRKAMPTKRQSP